MNVAPALQWIVALLTSFPRTAFAQDAPPP